MDKFLDHIPPTIISSNKNVEKFTNLLDAMRDYSLTMQEEYFRSRDMYMVENEKIFEDRLTDYGFPLHPDLTTYMKFMLAVNIDRLSRDRGSVQMIKDTYQILSSAAGNISSFVNLDFITVPMLLLDVKEISYLINGQDLDDHFNNSAISGAPIAQPKMVGSNNSWGSFTTAISLEISGGITPVTTSISLDFFNYCRSLVADFCFPNFSSDSGNTDLELIM